MKRHALTASTPLAIDPKSIQRDDAGFFLMLGPTVADNERHGSVAVVHIRGALAHYAEDGGDSYEAIEKRVRDALAEGQTSALVLRIESPGGVVSGLNETTQALKALSKSSGVPFYAYVDELASSAAYHLCCACEEILAPPSAVVGSVGVISTMVSLAKQDRMQGVEYRLITSGVRKTDGHLHAPITTGAEAAERDRNTKLAAQFFEVVRKARGMSVREIRDLEAGIYLSKDAKRIGLIDDVAGFDEVLLGLDARVSRGPAPSLGHGNVTDRRAKPAQALAQPDPAVSTCASAANEGEPMAVKLDALIAKTEAAIATEQDTKKRTKLAAQLAQYNATRVAMESAPPDTDDDDDEGDDESAAARANKVAARKAKMAEAAKHRAAASKHRAKAAEYEDAARKCESEDDDDEGAAEDDAATVAPIERGASASAIEDHVSQSQNKRIAKLESDLAERDKATAIATALSAGEITPAQAKMLANKRPAWVGEYLETTKGMRVVATAEGHLTVPKDAKVSATPEASALAEIDRRIDAMGVKDPAKVAELREKMITNRAAVLNGEGARY